MNRAQRRINTNPLQGLDLSILDADPNEMLLEAVERVEYIAAELIRPDPAQPRRILPEKTYTAFHSERLTPTQARRELVHIAQVTARQNGRPFDGVLDLLPNADVFRQVKENTPRHGLNAAADGSKVAWRLAGMKTCTDLGLRIIPLRVCPI